MKSTIVIFTGLPGTGKTTLSREVARAIRLPLVAKDNLKEIMYDQIGWSDKESVAKIARASLDIMDFMTKQFLENDLSLVLESNYWPNLASAGFQTFQESYDCRIIQIVCRTDARVLAKRCIDRQKSGRHPGHLDSNDLEGYLADIERRVNDGQDQPLDVDGPVRVVDTTDLSSLDSGEIIEWIESNIDSENKR